MKDTETFPEHQPITDVSQTPQPGPAQSELHIRVRSPENPVSQTHPVPRAAGEVALGGAEIDISLPMGEELRDQLLAVVENHLLQNRFTRQADIFKLSDRERQVAELLAQGHESSEIAQQLHLSPSTVKGYVTKLIDKTGGSNRAGVVGRLYGPPF